MPHRLWLAGGGFPTSVANVGPRLQPSNHWLQDSIQVCKKEVRRIEGELAEKAGICSLCARQLYFQLASQHPKKDSHVEFSQYFIGLSKQDLVLHVVDANSTSMISSGVNLQCIPGLGFLSTEIACVTAIEVDLAVSPHQGWVHHNFRAVEASPLRVLQSLHHWVQHRI